MKSADMLLAEKVRRMKDGVAEVRERMAAEVFAMDVVTEAMAKATSLGMNWVRIQPTRALDLSTTKAAIETAAQLMKAGAEVEWLPRATADPCLPERALDLLVRW